MSDESDECCVSGCGNKENRRNKIRLYRFPENKNKRQQWINTFNIVSVTTQEADDLNVCSQHYLLIKVQVKHLYLIPRLSNMRIQGSTT